MKRGSSLELSPAWMTRVYLRVSVNEEFMSFLFVSLIT